MDQALAIEIQRHLTQLDYIKKMSLYILDLVQSEKTQDLDSAVENRLRLINLTSKRQEGIESYLRELTPEALEKAKSLLSFWIEDIKRAVAQVEQIDQLIQLNLEELKNQTTKQISHLFRTRESFKGYNLTSTKR